MLVLTRLGVKHWGGALLLAVGAQKIILGVIVVVDHGGHHHCQRLRDMSVVADGSPA